MGRTNVRPMCLLQELYQFQVTAYIREAVECDSRLGLGLDELADSLTQVAIKCTKVVYMRLVQCDRVALDRFRRFFPPRPRPRTAV